MNGSLEECDGLVLFRGKVYVPLDAQLRHNIVEAHHDTPVTGHSGQWKTIKLVAQNYWWLGMGRYIAKYVKGCNFCNQTKMFPTAPVGKLMPNCIPYHWWQIILVDLITELPQSHGYDSILVAMDHLSKHTHFIATTSDITSPRLTQSHSIVSRRHLETTWTPRGGDQQQRIPVHVEIHVRSQQNTQD